MRLPCSRGSSAGSKRDSGSEDRARNMASGIFIGLAHVDQRDRSIRQTLFQFFARDDFNHYLVLMF